MKIHEGSPYRIMLLTVAHELGLDPFKISAGDKKRIQAEALKRFRDQLAWGGKFPLPKPERSDTK